MYQEKEIIVNEINEMSLKFERALNYYCSFRNYFTPLFTSLPFLVYRNATFKFPVKFVISESALVTFLQMSTYKLNPPPLFV